ncbi:IS110 family transposase [Cupriavidus consociatus]|uniref:IS110 family transposase n=1 Tax=Cupriavidus consociatus TaxID=2821357 RepID=UPI001AEACD9B|nr:MULTISPECIES: IS110 family transposase [unclassified Cupriavidus]MBP0625445.1 IS110 family transposase [Cupriavidus sp. LEh25]MDK2662190.1 IS110 family transposase [Cupriavidus sp. LEh21]
MRGRRRSNASLLPDQIHGVDRHGNAVLQRKLRRVEMLKYFANLEPSLVGIEACHGSHYWARELTALGHTVRLLPTQYVTPFLVGGKNDVNDAAAICAAVTRKDIHFVSIKSAEQQSLQSVHRMRERLVQDRTAKSNQIRSMFAEEGFVYPVGLHQLRKGIVELLGNPNARVTPVLRRLGAMYLEQMNALQQWIDELGKEIAEIFKCNEVCQRLATIPGIGPVIATALVSSVGDPLQFRNGRQFAAWLGLTPRQRSSGGKTKLGGITKRGDTYLRTLLVQGAHAVIHFVNRRGDPHSRWIKTLLQRRHPSIATVALANKTARIAWTILTRKEVFKVA